MPLDIGKILDEERGRNYELHSEFVNPQFARVLRTIGFNRCYERAEGPWLWDTDGRKYLDLLAGYGVFNMGRNHPEVRRVLVEFMQRDYPSLVQMEAPLLSGVLARELVRRMPEGLDTCYFTNSGTEGIETAIKFARCATGRSVIVHCKKSFHGLTNGSLAINGDESFRSGFAPFLPDCRMIPFDDLAALEEALADRDVAAFIVEPIQGKGVNIPREGYLREAAELCRRHGTLFVDDEVQTGMGRTGRFLAIEHEEGVSPDVVVLSKALSGGYVPVGAVITRRTIYERVFSTMERAVVHSSTFGQGSLAMAAGLAALTVIDEERLVERAEKMGRAILDGLESMVPRFDFLSEVRGRGLMIGIELGKPKSLALRTAYKMIKAMDENLLPQAVTIPLLDDHRILTQVAGHNVDVVKLLPPLVIGDEDVRWFLAGFEAVMNDLHRFPGPVWEVLKKLGKHAVSGKRRERVAARRNDA